MKDVLKIDVTLIPQIELKLFCLDLAEAAERFYEDPANEAAFQRWLAEREQESA